MPSEPNDVNGHNTGRATNRSPVPGGERLIQLLARLLARNWLGHRESKMARHYYHLHDEEAQRQMQRLNFLGDVGGDVAASDV